MDHVVELVTHQIVDAIRPKQIFLYGSRVSGCSGPESDIDLLVVYDGPLTKREVKLKIRNLFPHPGFSLDLAVLNSAEFSAQKRIPTTVGRTALQEGVVCYGPPA